MDLEQAIYSRRAVREYTEESVARQVLQDVIDAAIQAPSAVNEQPWLFTVVQDRALLDLISREAKAHLPIAPPQNLALQRFHELSDDPDFDIFYRAPALHGSPSPHTTPDPPGGEEQCGGCFQGMPKIRMSRNAHM